MATKDMYEDFGYDIFSNLSLLLLIKGYITSEEAHNMLAMKHQDFFKYILSRHENNNKDKV